MRRRRDQGPWLALAAATLATCLLVGRADAALPADGTGTAARERLATECDALMRQATKTPYGWVWRIDEPGQRPAGRNRIVTFDVRTTAAAGLALHLAGERLGEERFTSAAALVVKAVVAVQLNSGQFPQEGIIRANAGGRDDPAAVPRRAATCAALGLLLNVTHKPDAEGPMRRAAVKGAHWLASQQTRSGGWLVAYPPDVAPGDATRLVRLDAPDYRDATSALWLGAHVLDDERLLAKAEQSTSDLLALRIPDEKSAGHNLWSTAYHGDGTMVEKVAELHPAIDSLASRHAMEALLAAALCGGSEDATDALKEAAAALEKLPTTAGAWRRRYDLHIRPPKPQNPDDPPVAPLFEKGGDGAGESETVSGVGDVIKAAIRLAGDGPEPLRSSLDAELPVVQRIGMVLCGLKDDALTAARPSAAEGRTQDDLPGQLRRIAVLAWQVKPASDGDRLNGEKRTSG